MPRRINRSDRRSITSIALSLRATRIARHSWVNSSSTLSIRYLRPSWVRSSTKSDMIALLRPQPDARSVGQPEPAAFGLLMRDLQPLALPDTLDPLVVDCPARLAQQFGDLAIAIAAVLPSKLDNIGGETLLVLTTARDLALCRAMLPERRTGATLGDMQLRSDLLNAGTATRGA